MSLIISFSLIYLIYRVLTCKEGKLFAIKEYIAHIYLKYFYRKAKSRLGYYDYDHPSDLKLNNVLPNEEEIELENRTQNDPNKRDGMLVFGYNSKGEHLVARITIQGNKARVWIQLKIKGKLYTLPREKLWNVPKTEANCFAAAGLRLKCLSPFKKCRVSFNGLLREKGCKKDVHVKFSFIWTASAEPFDHKDIANIIMEYYLAGIKWNSWLPNSGLLPNTPDVLDQAGNLTGTVVIEGGEENEVLLWGARIRSFGNSENEENLKEYFVYMSEGEYIHITDTGKFLYGFIVHSNTDGGDVEKLKIEHQPNEETEAKFTFSRGKNDFKLTIKSTRDNVNSVNDAEFATDRTYIISNAILNDDEKGFSIIVETRQNAQSLSQNKEGLSIADTAELVLKISDDRCKNVDCSGGKGSSLAELKDISRSNSSFTVPSGFVVTTVSYQTFIEINIVKEILKKFAFEDVVWGNVEGDLKSVCQKIENEISNMELPTPLKKIIEENLKEYDNSTMFAVRSSASGEDSEEMSAAGQMETYLGVQGLDSILKAIAKCWASQFSHTAIQYKKQNGQELNSPMAVVVQEMIAAEQAGVMFTCNPLTGNPENITITANYGLGESVVSATAEPDTIVVKRDAYGNVEIDSVQIGRKLKKTVLAKDGGVADEEVSDSETGKCCLSSEIALQLAKLAHEVEESYGCPLDIEWAVVKNSIYLLQARPVTTVDRETDYELIHESDVQLRSEFECYSKANVGEVMPGAMSELGHNFICKLMEISMQNHWSKKSSMSFFKMKPHIQSGLVLASKHVLFNLTDTLYRLETKQDGSNTMTKAYEIGMFARILNDEDLKLRAIRRNRFYQQKDGKLMIFRMIKDIVQLEKTLKRVTKFINEYKITLNKDTTAEEYLYQILQELFKLSKYTQPHGSASMSSLMYSLVALSVLAKANKGEWNEVVFGDFAKLVASCKEVESVDVPYALQELASTIKDCIDPEKFRQMSIEEGLDWFQTSGTEASKQFTEFLTKHGHRCLKEFDLETLPWRADPRPLVKSLQEMTKSAKKPKKNKSIINDTINSLKTPLNWKTRLILKFIVPFCETAVGRRERSKSTFIKIVDHFRKEFYTLADKMAQEGRLPDKKLIFFLNIHELVQLLQTRSPKLIQKAIRRKNLHPIVDAYRFPEITKGLPKPMNAQKPLYEHVEGDLTLKGTPVSQGVVKARVRVANNLEEAALLQPGEILIAYSTDIGWSPYFPILAGVVTELGGLISHGAVVAREYGLPCVVALHGATSMFKTGEMAILDGNKGTLQRVLE